MSAAVPNNNWAYTSFIGEGGSTSSTYLVLGDTGSTTSYALTSFSCAFAMNQIPEAMCILSLGRRLDSGSPSAADAIGILPRMTKAQVWTRIVGNFSVDDNTKWPSQATDVYPKGYYLAFDGYFTGSAYQKIGGKVNYVAHLVHWLVDLTMSSALSSASHVANSAILSCSAVTCPAIGTVGADGLIITTDGPTLASLLPASGMGAYVSGATIETDVFIDFWAAIKTLLCAVAGYKDGLNTKNATISPIFQGIWSPRALTALQRFEGPTFSTDPADKANSMPYVYGQPLPLTIQGLNVSKSGVDIQSGLSQFLAGTVATTLWNTTLWDWLVSGLLPMFGMALCPAVDRVVIVADIPAFRAPLATNTKGASAASSIPLRQTWRTIPPEDYEFVAQNSLVPRPLRAVIAVSGNAGDSDTSGVTTGTSGSPGGGADLYAIYPPDAAQQAIDNPLAGAGVVLIRSIPPWIYPIITATPTAGTASGQAAQTAVQSSLMNIKGTTTPPASTALTALDTMPVARDLLERYAQTIFYTEGLRGRSGQFSGKLRFDIAPGAHIRLAGSPELFLGGKDALASDLYAQVSRVTLEINSEAQRAVTAFAITHQRTPTENNDDMTSGSEHPLFLKAVTLGFPLQPTLLAK